MQRGQSCTSGLLAGDWFPFLRFASVEPPAAGLLSWTDKQRLLHDFAGCMTCARKEKTKAEAAGFTVRSYKYSEKDNYEQESKV